MNKTISLLFLCSILTFTSCKDQQHSSTSSTNTSTNNNSISDERTSETNSETVANGDSIIKDSSNNYGGTRNFEKYGRGTPLNGEQDIENSCYFSSPDFYNLSSNQTRLMYSKYQTYQQTMADSDGIASALMVLNRDGYDVNKYNEEYLYNLYESKNKTTIKDNGTTAAGLNNLFSSFDYKVEYGTFNFGSGNTTFAKRVPILYRYIIDSLYDNYTVLMKIHKDDKSRWKVVVGVDGKSPHNITDDIIIYGDSNDRFDHKQDGFSFEPIMHCLSWWRTLDDRGRKLDNFSFVRVKNKKQNDVSRKYEKQVVNEEIPELHMLCNDDGSYGGTTNALLYGIGVPKNGPANCYDSIYFKFPDIYNFESTSSLHILSNYRAYQQTMASTCGICSTMSVLAYYDGLATEMCPRQEYNEITLLNNYETINNVNIKGRGIGFPGLRKMLTTYYGYTNSSYTETSYTVSSTKEKPFPTVSSLRDRLISNIDSGFPTIVCMCPTSGHYEVIFGYDDMGTETCDDDVIILADSADRRDHFQDGYNIYNANSFYARWFNGSLGIGQMSLTIQRQ